MHFLLNTFLIILSLFSSKNENDKESIHYIYDKNETYTVENITSATSFIPLKEDINNGLAAGVYWFKISPEKASNKRLVIINSHILKAKLFVGNNIFLPRKKESFITFNIPKVKTPVFVKVYIEREAYIPIRIAEENNFLSEKFKTNFFDGIYYGIIVMLCVLNLLYYFYIKEITFVAYLYFLIAINIGLLFTDGTLNTFFDFLTVFKSLELINHFFVAISGVYFASTFLELNFYYPKHKKYSLILFTLMFVFFIAYFISSKFIFHVIIEVIVFLILGMYLFYGFLMYKKSNFAKYFSWAYSAIFFIGLQYFVGRDIGFVVLDIKSIHLKIGGLLEMFLISYAIVYRMNILKKQNELMREGIFKYLKQINHLKEESVEDIIAIKENEFSKQELEIIQAISNELSNKEIAKKLYISVSTVKYHTKKIYTKLEIASRKEIQKKNIQLIKQL